MKSKKLNEAFNHVDDIYLDTTEREKRKKHPVWVRWTALAACLCLLVGLGAWLLPQRRAIAPGIQAVPMPGMAPIRPYQLALAAYPVLTPYPNEREYVNEKTGEFNDEAFRAVYDRWREDRQALHDQPAGFADSLSGFWAQSIPVFLSGTAGENQVYSPLNVYMALAMLAETTDGASRAQILSALGAEDLEALRAQAEQVWKACYYNDGGTASILANSLWLQEGMQYNQETLNRLADTYYASSFSGEMGSTVYNEALQQWLNQQTDGLLEEQVSQEQLNARTILALASTVYFRCKWAGTIWEQNTKPQTFHLAGGTDVTCDFMHTSGSDHYFWADQFGAVCWNLEDDFQMWFLLPDEGITPEALLSDPQTMEFLQAGWQWENNKYLIVNQAVPKFDIAGQNDLRPGLQALGVTDVMESGVADFSPLGEGGKGAFLSNASHGVRVAIDEEGVTAASYTVMATAGAGMPPEDEIDFTLDRPFLFAITGPENLPLFVGIVNNPAG